MAKASTPQYGLIVAASIAAVATITVGYLEYGRSTPKEQLTYVGRVIDANSGAPLRAAKVVTEIRGAPPIVYTDSEGVYTFQMEHAKGEVLEGRVRVTIDGYRHFDRNISIGVSTALEDIRLEPKISPSKKSVLRDPRNATTVPIEKLSFAAGSSIAMLGYSNSGAAVFETALSGLGLPRGAVEALSKSYREREMEVTTRSSLLKSVISSQSALLKTAADQIAVLRGRFSADEVSFGYHVTALLLLLDHWSQSVPESMAVEVARSNSDALNSFISKSFLREEQREQLRQVCSLNPSVVGDRQSAIRILGATLARFDMNPL